jgi:uncharacterized protein (TIGR03086 family)
VSEVSDRYARIAGGFTARIAAVPAQAWEARSPCTEWAARDVAVHVVDTHHRVLATLTTSEPQSIARDDDLAGAFGEASSAVLSSLGDPALAVATVGGPFGEQPFESLVGRLLCADTLIHTWDLARATAQDEALDPDAVAKALEFLTPIDEAIRRPGGFGPKIEPEVGADTQTRLLNFAGRPA